MASERITFIESLRNLVLENISDERFGVTELAAKAGMSRSNLLRRIRKETDQSANQFIRNIRLQYAMELLRDESSSVSEVAFMSGFNSVSYFVKCFGDRYGYPPGEVRAESRELRAKEEEDNPPSIKQRRTMEGEKERGREGEMTGMGEWRRSRLVLGIVSTLMIVVVLIVILNPFAGEQNDLDNSIAVLPFKNDSSDTTNIYFINGLMESLLNNLQSIEDLRVVSRTSVEKYRYAPMIIPEIAKELNVSYFVEGSGQKSGDEILLNIQLVEAATDRQIWSKQFRRKLEDVFEMQAEIAASIAASIQVSISPEEEGRISKPATENMLAYDIFLKGLDLLNNPVSGNLEKALDMFLKALEEDNEFARAYAAVAITYYMMDKDLASKKYTELINTYADRALLYDDQLAQSLIAKGLYYMSTEQYPLAISYFEKALEYNPNSDLVYVFLVDLYANYSPDTEKYLEYALKGLQINMAPYDSVTRSYAYLHISNAFIQSGFIDEAEEYINKSLSLYPDNLYSAYVKPYILYSRSLDLEETKEKLLDVLERDTTRVDIIQEVAKICYYLRDFDEAYKYYSKFVEIRDYLDLDIYRGEDGKIAVVFAMIGDEERSDKYLERFKNYAESTNSVYKHLSLSAYYSYTGDIENSLEQLELFSKEDNYHYWTILFMEIDPLMDNILETDEFKKIFSSIESHFESYHRKVKSRLEAEGLI